MDGTLASAAKGRAEQKPGVPDVYIGAKWPARSLSTSFQDIQDIKTEA